MSQQGVLHRLAAFTEDPAGGNPAGVWVGQSLPSPKAMQAIAADVGFSETAFIAPAKGLRRTVRYYSPEREIPFCGHATIASGFILGKDGGDGLYTLDTAVGEVAVSVQIQHDRCLATLTSVTPEHEQASESLVERALAALDWGSSDLDPAIPPARAYAGAWHLVLAVTTPERLALLNYNFGTLKELMLEDDLATLQLIWKESEGLFHSRNPFPVGGIIEDPATGAAAAALGGYLRDAGLVTAPTTFTVLQGEQMGRPSRLTVKVPEHGGIEVSGSAVHLEDDTEPLVGQHG